MIIFLESKIKVENSKPFNSCVFGLSDIIKTNDLPKSNNIGKNKITVVQPQQRMFYGRLLAGIRSKHNEQYILSKSFVLRHITYQRICRVKSGKRAYPFMPEKKMALLFYPSMSPSKGRILVKVYEESKPEPILIYNKLRI